VGIVLRVQTTGDAVLSGGLVTVPEPGPGALLVAAAGILTRRRARLRRTHVIERPERDEAEGSHHVPENG
jgi:Putative transmembrane protein (PGPGW)